MLKVLLFAGTALATFASIDHAGAKAGLHAHSGSSHRAYASLHPVSHLGSSARAEVGTPRVTPLHKTPRTGGQTGKASYYEGSRRTANGGRVEAATCAHPTLPFGTRVRITNLSNAHQAVLTVNDRGPFVRGRIVDVSAGAASLLGMLQTGTALVRVEVIGPA